MAHTQKKINELIETIPDEIQTWIYETKTLLTLKYSQRTKRNHK